MRNSISAVVVRGALLVAATLFGTSAYAGLIGHDVTGEIYFGANPANYFDPANGFVPGGFLNAAGATVTIGDPDVEFGFQDGANRDTADFTDTQLMISDQVFLSASNWMMRFTSATPGLFTSLSLVSDTFDPALTYSLLGDVITIEWAGTLEPNSFSAVFDVGSTEPVPEPGSLLLLGAGLVGLGRRLRRP